MLEQLTPMLMHDTAQSSSKCMQALSAVVAWEMEKVHAARRGWEAQIDHGVPILLTTLWRADGYVYSRVLYIIVTPVAGELYKT